MRVFFSSASFARSYGGPAYSVARLAQAVAEAGAEVALWAPDGSAVNLPVSFSRLRLLGGTLREALFSFGPIDVLHDSGLWLAHNRAIAGQAARNGTRLVVSTRGMLNPWALAYKRARKAVAWHLYQRRNLSRAFALHVSSTEEDGHVARLGLGPPIFTIPNGVDLPTLKPRIHGDMRRTAVFLGRLHPVKGLPLLLDAWGALRPPGWELVVAGPDEGGFKVKLDAQVARLGLGSVVSLPGLVYGAAKDELLRRASLFVLPSHSESFGMAVAEAFAFGLPVLTTTAVPWPQVEQQRCGWRVRPCVDDILAGLRRATALPEDDLRAMGARGRRLVESTLSWTAIAPRFLSLYRGELPN